MPGASFLLLKDGITNLQRKQTLEVMTVSLRNANIYNAHRQCNNEAQIYLQE